MLDQPHHCDNINFSKLSFLSACKKMNSSFTSFLTYGKEIANLLFWVIWTCLDTKPLMFICRQKINFTFSLRYCKDIVNLLLWVCTLKVILSTCRKLLCLSAGKKSTSSPMLFWIYCKDMQTTYFGYFQHACFLHTQNDSIVGIKGLGFVNHESVS